MDDPRKTVFDRPGLFFAEDPLSTEHPRVGQAATNIVERDTVVELKRARESGDSSLEPGAEPTGPEWLLFFAHFFRLVGLAFLGAVSAFFGMSSDASLPSPQSA